jgi:diguanylate cyclase (GGDEF)-like protein/PAS domain S-box-containing protein
MTKAALDLAREIVLVGHIARAHVLECAPGTTVAEAVSRMREARCGSIVVVDGGQAVGIWTGNDVVRLDFLDPAVLETPVSAVMSAPVKSIRQDALLREAALRFRQEGFRHLLVVDASGNRVGVISQTDVINNQGIEFFVHLRDVRSAMRAGPLVVAVDRPVIEVIGLMRDSAQDAVVVADGSHLGVFTSTDLLAMIADRDFQGTIGRRAHFPLHCVTPSASLFEARAIFVERRIRHLGVLEADRLVGLLTYADILECVEQVYLRELQQTLAEQSGRLLVSQHSLQLARAVAEASHQGIVITTADGIVESVNPAFTAITGYAADEVVGRNLRLLRSDRHDREFFQRMFGCLLERGTWSGEIWNRHKDGTLFLEMMTITLVRGIDGAVANYVGVFTDITRQREEQLRLLHTTRQLEVQENFYRAILDTLPVNVFVKDERQRYLLVNDHAAALLGMPKEQVCGRTDFELFPPDTAARLQEADAPVIDELRYVVDENTVSRPGGDLTLLAHKRGLELGGRRLLIGASVDISSRRLAERRLADERAILELIAGNAGATEILEAICRQVEQYLHGGLAAILVCDEAREQLRHGASPSMPESFASLVDGLAIGPAVGSSGTAAHLGEPVIVEDITTDSRWLPFRKAAAEHGLRSSWSFPILSARRQVLGTFSQYFRSPRRPNGLETELVQQGARLAAIAIERAQASAQLHRMATVDTLTGLANRQHFFSLARRELARTQRSGRPLAAFMIDVDHFKRINDSHGHAAGDVALRTLAGRFAEEIRSMDICGRLGGEEFAMLLPDTDETTALQVAERLRGLVADEPFPLDQDLAVPVTVSIGVGLYRDRDDLDRLLARTDNALYRAKHEGRNRVVLG